MIVRDMQIAMVTRQRQAASARAVNFMTRRRSAHWHKAPRFAWLLLPLLLVDTSAWPAQTQSLDSIREAVHRFVAAQPQRYIGTPRVDIGQLDPRLRLSSCATPLQVSFPRGSRLSGNTTVGVRCRKPKPWTVYVPLRISLFKKVVVTTRPVSRGLPLKRDDLMLQNRDLANLTRDYLTDPKLAVGMVARRPLSMGSVLSPDMLQAPRLIRRGEQITIIAKSAGLEVRMAGEALADGARGEIIRVRNLLTKKVIQAVVTETGIVKVRM